MTDKVAVAQIGYTNITVYKNITVITQPIPLTPNSTPKQSSESRQEATLEDWFPKEPEKWIRFVGEQLQSHSTKQGRLVARLLYGLHQAKKMDVAYNNIDRRKTLAGLQRVLDNKFPDRVGREGLPSDIEEHMLPDGDAITVKLLGALRNGDHAAYNVVYRHYRDLIVNLIFKMLRSREDAEEIAQNVFMALWERRAELDPQKNIRTLLYTIARNAVMNQFKRQKVFEKYLKLSDADDTENLTAEDILIARERECLIETTVGKMPSKRRKIYEMSRRENLSNEDIAQRLDTSRQNVANHLSQALRQIRHALGR